MAANFIVTVVHFTENNRIGTMFAETWESAWMMRDTALATWACDVHISAMAHTTYTARNANGTRMHFTRDKQELIAFVK